MLKRMSRVKYKKEARLRPRAKKRAAALRLLRLKWGKQGGYRRAQVLSPAARSEIARLGYQAMLRKRYEKILEIVLFGVID